MIISNLFQGPISPKTVTGVKWEISSTYTDIHSKTSSKYVWVHAPQEGSWIGFCLDGSAMDENYITENLSVDLAIKEVDYTSLHNTQLHSALLKALVVQTVGMNNFNNDIYPTNNLNFFEGIQIDMKFIILTDIDKEYIFLRIDTKNTARKLDSDEGLLSTDERFGEIQKFIEHYWPKGISFTFGGQKFNFSSNFFKIGA